MGIIFGKIIVEMLKYKFVEKKGDIEIREYELVVVVEVSYDFKFMKSGRDGGFMIFVRYIGVIGIFYNKKGLEFGEKIVMIVFVII